MEPTKSESMQVKAGSWVEIEQMILKPEERSQSLPEDTKQTPYMLRVSGFLKEDAAIGQPAHIRTIIGRELTGTLLRVNPSYSHSFGTIVPELLTICTEMEK